jgi:hypothetical protein
LNATPPIGQHLAFFKGEVLVKLTVCIGVVGLLVTGCGTGGFCDEPSGMYRVNLTRRSGTCVGSIESVQRITPSSDPNLTSGGSDSGCYDRSEVSQNLCEIEIDQTCGSSTMTGQLRWTHDASHAEGIVAVQISGSSGCQGTYDVEYTRL